MIKRPEQIKLLALGRPDVPANRSSDSSSSSAQTTNTTTNVTDRRFVNDGGGAGVAGDNNAVWNSVSTTNVTTDLGAIAGAMDLAKTGIQTSHDNLTSAAGLASQTFNKAVDANATMFGQNTDQMSANRSSLMDGFSKLLDASKTVMQTAQDVNRTATQDVQQAYANAQEISNGQKFLVAGGLVIAGIVAVTAMKGKVL
ncbi:TPA: hypothetical protein QDB24_000457 [Burkholderia vietnamiensis]|uniref:hypothetical protein n=1 Tax=Burkholderia cepacia complex TaxID=87882 RepID=UPI0017497C7B|nr:MULTISPECIES: hypothetical protein [Burkholderia cepacia complex]MBD1410249.1 hypothetical protein [Burkholderia contaminans]MBR7908571.1 hypothetical protein [Burkholderia vietnamiensis]UXZ70028.1 hypothetical protein NUJ29_31085 [Burkholderia contaminans]UXZ76735.1 hypothetical protein NUJ30_25485 [Burkholderia contaminans]HDR9272441.1 hypothetical protein [Burkholderia vietnamiensis]